MAILTSQDLGGGFFIFLVRCYCWPAGADINVDFIVKYMSLNNAEEASLNFSYDFELVMYTFLNLSRRPVE